MNNKKKNVIIVVVVIALIAGAGIIYNSVKKANSPKLTQQEVKKIALDDAALTNDNLHSLSVSYDDDDNEYEIDILTKDESNKYEYTIDGNSGKIKKRDYESIAINESNISKNNKEITIEKAKNIALKDAGFKSSEVKFVVEKYENDDKEFDIEFIGKDKSDSKEYKYEYSINNKGKILSKEKDRDLN